MSAEEQQIRVTTFDVEKDPGDFHAALALREVVFIEEQSVPESVERDAEDAKAYHVLAWDGPHAVGTGRLIELSAPPPGESGRWGQIGRMAVVTANRGRRVGSHILRVLEEQARRSGMNGVKMHAQKHTVRFYEKMGYQTVGEEFEEAGMTHIEARKRLD